MYKTILVETDIDEGRRVLEKLAKLLPVTAAFWYHFEDEDEWKLVVVSTDVSDKGPRLVYSTVLTLLEDLAKDPQEPLRFPLDRIKVVSPGSLIYDTVKQRTGPKNGPVREGRALDAYIYKLA